MPNVTELWEPIKNIITPVSVTPGEDYRAKLIAGVIYWIPPQNWSRYFKSPNWLREIKTIAGLPIPERWKYAQSEKEKWLAMRWKVIYRRVTRSDLPIIDQLTPEHKKQIMDALKITQPELLLPGKTPSEVEKEKKKIAEEYYKKTVERVKQLPKVISSAQFIKLPAEDRAKYSLIAEQTWELKPQYREIKAKVEAEEKAKVEKAKVEKAKAEIPEKKPVSEVAYKKTNWIKWILPIGLVAIVIGVMARKSKK